MRTLLELLYLHPKSEEVARTLLAFIIAVFSLSLIIASIREAYRSHLLRSAGVLFIFSLSLISHHAMVYFAAVFIIGTVVTTTEFLQKLVAIIRGDSKYFDYLIKELSAKEVERSAEEEIQEEETEGEAEGDPRSQKEMTLSAPPRRRLSARDYVEVERLAIEWLSRKVGRAVRYHVGLRYEGFLWTLDGLIEGDRMDTLIEVRAFLGPARNRSIRERISTTLDRTLPKLIETATFYRIARKREVETKLILVASLSREDADFAKNFMANKLPNTWMQPSLDVVSLEEIGWELPSKP